MKHNLKVASSFNEGAARNNHNAFVQDHVNDHLLKLVLFHEPHLKEASILEVGCGTGQLSAQLTPQSGTYTLCDISEAMVSRALKTTPTAHGVVVDGQNPCFTASFDVIVSSLSLHWFQDPRAGLHQLIGCLKPGGRLYLTTMGNHSFYEWRTAHTLLDAPCGTPEFVAMAALKTWLPAQGHRSISEEWVVQGIQDPKAYFKDLKRRGAGLAHPGHKPLPPPTFNKVLEKFSETQKISYQILTATYQKPIDFREE